MMTMYYINFALILLVALLFFKIRSSKKKSPVNVLSPSPFKISPDDTIWKTILQLTKPGALPHDWCHCFNQINNDLCLALEADELFLLKNNILIDRIIAEKRDEQTPLHDHNWILSVPTWMNLLQEGHFIHSTTEDFELEEEIVLRLAGVKVLLLIPLIADKDLLGCIGICKHSDVTLFNQQQINSLRFISNILTMAIGNQQNRSEIDRLVTVVEQSSDCIIITNTSGTILYANSACKTVTGFSPAEIMYRPIKNLYRSSMRKNLWQRIKVPLRDGTEWSGQFANYRKDNSLYQEKIQISPVYDHHGKVANQVIIKRDITEEKRLESIAEAANLMDNIGFIFSSIRHELGNPINSIKVSLSVLESNLDTYDHKDIKRFIHRSLSDISRVEFLLKTLKNFSVFERPDITETDMRTLLNKLIQLTEKELAAQYVMVATDIPEEPLVGMLDPRAFLQVLLNLITNAVAAMQETENKTLILSMARKQENQIIFVVEDNGCGMDEEGLRNLFRPFFTTKQEGTGLGLVIVKKMLSKMNCSITASSKKESGTRMEIVIPAG